MIKKLGKHLGENFYTSGRQKPMPLEIDYAVGLDGRVIYNSRLFGRNVRRKAT